MPTKKSRPKKTLKESQHAQAALSEELCALANSELKAPLVKALAMLLATRPEGEVDFVSRQLQDYSGDLEAALAELEDQDLREMGRYLDSTTRPVLLEAIEDGLLERSKSMHRFVAKYLGRRSQLALKARPVVPYPLTAPLKSAAGSKPEEADALVEMAKSVEQINSIID
eukprot:gene30254-37791_t